MNKLVCLILCMFVGTVNATFINNGSFETGSFNGWTTQDLSTPFYPVQVVGSGVSPGFGLFLSSPTDGNFAAVNGFDGGGPGVISLSQNITVDSSSTILFDYRAGWDMLNFGGSTLNRLFDVNINSLGGPNLANFNILSAAAGTINLDTGNMTGSVDLSGFVGQTVNISFEWMIPENFTGPAFFQLDNVTSTASVPEPLSIAILGFGLAGVALSRKKKVV
ncbi:PEP-CTERM sorting domain-containing protein [Thalassotalea aquiviva]|uniref:PEP-CTERM sorting domain-containing protein n=1 Tax=Thalassotalea aquiviva TaxID=3242415 RepID=UPI00352B16A5